MIDLEKSKIEAEALAKLRKEQYFREVLAGELGVMIDQYFASKEPLRKVIPEFVKGIIKIGLTAKEILDYIEGKKEEAPEPTAEEAQEAPSTAAVKVSNERIEQLQAEGLSPTQIAKVTGMKPDTVTHRIRYNKDKIDRQRGVTKAAPQPRVLSKDIISDTELEEQYFKFGKTVKEIAQKYGIKPDGLYKRVEAMKAERQNIAKECVSSQQ